MKALVVKRPGSTPEAEDIIGWAHDNMAAYKVPRMIEFVDALPKSATGKVMWRALAGEGAGAPGLILRRGRLLEERERPRYRRMAACSSSARRAMTILLSTLNARYAHASLGLRYLLANMGELQGDTRAARIRDRHARPPTSSKNCWRISPRIIGFGVYIWNVEETTKVVAMLKRVAPDVVDRARRAGSIARAERAANRAAGRLPDHRLGRRDLPASCAANPAWPASR